MASNLGTSTEESRWWPTRGTYTHVRQKVRTWMLMRYVEAFMMYQDWQGFQLYKAYLYHKDATRDDVTFMASAFTGEDVPTEGVLELRYSFRGKKYRVRFRKDDDVKFPPYTVCEVPRAPRCNVLIAMQGASNVTAKVQKYAGPMGDFHYTLNKHIPTAVDMTGENTQIRVMDTKFRQAFID
jgi:hypothetical protein